MACVGLADLGGVRYSKSFRGVVYVQRVTGMVLNFSVDTGEKNKIHNVQYHSVSDSKYSHGMPYKKGECEVRKGWNFETAMKRHRCLLYIDGCLALSAKNPDSVQHEKGPKVAKGIPGENRQVVS